MAAEAYPAHRLERRSMNSDKKKAHYYFFFILIMWQTFPNSVLRVPSNQEFREQLSSNDYTEGYFVEIRRLHRPSFVITPFERFVTTSSLVLITKICEKGNGASDLYS